MIKCTDYGENLKLSGLKNTKHRTAILDILEQSSQPVAADQVFLELKTRDISVNLSTVYRTLDILTDKKLVLKLNITGGGRTLFEYNRKVHSHYLVCLGCKKILCIDRCPLGGYEKTLERETRYWIAGHKLDIYGYCPVCLLKGGQNKAFKEAEADS